MPSSVLLSSVLTLSLLSSAALGQGFSLQQQQDGFDGGGQLRTTSAIEVSAYPSGYFAEESTNAGIEPPSTQHTAANLWVLGGFAMLLCVGGAITGFCIQQRRVLRKPQRAPGIHVGV